MPSYQSKIVGMRFYSGAVARVKRLPRFYLLELVREPVNPYDDNAIAVHDPGSAFMKLGHIPRSDAIVIAPLMDAGVAMECKINPDSPDVVIRWRRDEALRIQQRLKAVKRGRRRQLVGPGIPDDDIPF